jgi:ribulose 1,5-bisphosphate carboxylase large subunit-like protein
MESIRATYSASTNLPLDEFAERMAVAQTIGLKELDLDQLEFPEETRREVKACIANASWRPTGARQKKGEAPAAEAGPPQVFELDYPIGVFDRTGGLGQLLAVVAGQLTAYVDALRLRLIDLDLPRTILKRFRGPRFGNVGIRRQLGRNADRGPLLGVIMRPNLGLRPAQYADIAFEIAAGGADFIKDDEKFSNPAYCPYEERVPLVLEKLAAAKKVSGRQTLYIVNATARANEIPRTIRKLKKMGAGAILLPGFCVGLALVEGIVRTCFGLPIYCHRAGYATLAR